MTLADKCENFKTMALKMISFPVGHRRRHFLPVFQRFISLQVILLVGSVYFTLLSFHVVGAVSGPNGPRFSPLLPPPQVLVPPHREEGQSLDDILYGTSFSGSSLQFGKKTHVELPRPNIFSTSPPKPPSVPPQPSFSRNINNNILNIPTTSQRPILHHHSTHNFNHGPTNSKLVQAIAPPSPSPPSSNSVFPPSPSSSNFGSSSAEEIKVPQTVKHRTPQRKQYTKADLIAAANSLKPAGFDFSKILIVTPSNNHLNVSSSSLNGQDSPTIYNQVMFPLPLFDTPVYNQLKPLMEMLMRAKFNLGGGSVDDSNKVLVIIPKTTGSVSTNIPTGRSAIGANSNPLLNNSKPPLKHQLQSSATTTSSKASPSLTSKFVLPKASVSKHITTDKPKSLLSQGLPTTTTKRASKLGQFALPAATHAKAVTGKKSEKGPDLQAAATTSNKLSQRHGGNSSTSGATPSEKRSYSSKGGDNYSFSYAVKNDAYKDVKSHSESRNGDTVAGEYSMLEPDGYTRVVRYTVDSDQGFKASVKRIPPSS